MLISMVKFPQNFDSFQKLFKCDMRKKLCRKIFENLTDGVSADQPYFLKLVP